MGCNGVASSRSWRPESPGLFASAGALAPTLRHFDLYAAVVILTAYLTNAYFSARRGNRKGMRLLPMSLPRTVSFRTCDDFPAAFVSLVSACVCARDVNFRQWSQCLAHVDPLCTTDIGQD